MQYITIFFRIGSIVFHEAVKTTNRFKPLIGIITSMQTTFDKLKSGYYHYFIPAATSPNAWRIPNSPVYRILNYGTAESNVDIRLNADSELPSIVEPILEHKILDVFDICCPSL